MSRHTTQAARERAERESDEAMSQIKAIKALPDTLELDPQPPSEWYAQAVAEQRVSARGQVTDILTGHLAESAHTGKLLNAIMRVVMDFGLSQYDRGVADGMDTGQARHDKARAEGLAEGLRESDARAEANHLTGYRQGRRDAFRDALRLLGAGARLPSLAQWLASQVHCARADLRDLPHPHPGGTDASPVAARVSPKPTCACVSSQGGCPAEVEQEGALCDFCSRACADQAGS